MYPIFVCSSTGCIVSFQTLEMSYSWWTSTTQKKIVEIPNPHIILFYFFKLAKHGLSYRLKRGPRSISKITFCANWGVTSINTELIYFQANALSLQNSILFLQIHPTELIQAKILLIWTTNNSCFWEFSKLCIHRANSQIG